MHILRCQDASHHTTYKNQDIWFWKTDQPRHIGSPMISYILKAAVEETDDTDEEMATSQLWYGKQLLFQHPGMTPLEEAWPHIAYVLLAHDFLCEPLQSTTSLALPNMDDCQP